LIEAVGLPVVPPDLPANEFLVAMGMDKKVVDGRLRLILVRGIGDAFVSDSAVRQNLDATLTAGGALCNG
jgi:3-dehydroquinate synthase